MNSYARCLFLFLSFLCAGCQHQAASFLWPDSDYADMTRAWTRHHTFYDGIEVALDVHVLLKSWQWRQSALQKEAKDYALRAGEYQVRQNAVREAHTRGVDCIVALAGNTEVELHLPRSFGKLYLCFDGQRVEPLEIRRLKWSEAKLRSAFSFWTPWQEVYSVHFPVVPKGECSVLLTGPFGSASFVWENFQ